MEFNPKTALSCEISYEDVLDHLLECDAEWREGFVLYLKEYFCIDCGWKHPRGYRCMCEVD